MIGMTSKKSPISDREILYIGISGVKDNLTLNLENPLGPGETLWAKGDEPMPRVEPARVLEEYNIIIVDPADLGHIKNPSHAFRRRRTELLGFLAQGGLLVCILRKVDPVKNFQSSDIAMNYDFIVQGWHNFTEPLGASIKKFNITQEGHRSSFAEVLKGMQEAKVYLDNIRPLWGQHGSPDLLQVDITPFAFGSNKKVVAFEAKPIPVEVERPSYRYRGLTLVSQGETLLGKMVFLPDYALNDVDLLVECAKTELMQMGTAGFVPAEWTDNYKFQDHDKYISGIENLKTKLAGIQQELESKEKEFAELKETRDILLNGTGIPLQQKVKQVFNEIGIPFEEGPKGEKGEERDDLILKDTGGKTILVCEAKGLKGSASEADATQLNKWCDRVYEEEMHETKGLLIANAWRVTDPKERDEPPFPDQMLPYCNKRGFCLMTTVQLFNIWCKFKRGELKENILKKIMDTNGKQLEGYDAPNANRIK